MFVSQLYPLLAIPRIEHQVPVMLEDGAEYYLFIGVVFDQENGGRQEILSL